MTPFVKIYASMLTSSIWSESSETRVVWITMLAAADEDGVVAASIGGLARLANVTREACEAALQVLMSPDPDDRSGVDEGRRIEVEPGVGWRIKSARRYREMRTRDQVTAAARQARARAAHRQPATDRYGNGSLRDVTGSNARDATDRYGNDSLRPLRAEGEGEREGDPMHCMHGGERGGGFAPPHTPPTECEPGIPDSTLPASGQATLPGQDAPTPRKGRQRKAPEHPIPDDWAPTDGARRMALDLRIDCDREAARFRDHAAAHDRRCVDWHAAFRNWLRRAEELGAPRGQPAPAAPKPIPSARDEVKRLYGVDLLAAKPGGRT